MPDHTETIDPYSSIEAVDDGPLPLARRGLARRLSAVVAEAVPVTLMRTVQAPGPHPYDALVYALVGALRENCRLNAVFEQGRFRSFRQVNLGFAFDGPRGLVVPVVVDAGAMNPAELKAARATFAERVRDQSLTMLELAGGTFTVSNLGAFGIEYFTPVLNPPQVGILGVGRAAGNGGSWRLPLSLTFDHRVGDGVAAAMLLSSMQERLDDARDHAMGASR